MRREFCRRLCDTTNAFRLRNIRRMHKWRFIESMVADAPDHKGVYVLWSGAVALAVGHALGGADRVRSRLLSHLSHESSSGIGNVTHYSWQICADPRQHAVELERELGLRDEPKRSDLSEERVFRLASDREPRRGG